MYKVQHWFLHRGHDLPELFSRGVTMAEFCQHLEFQAEKFSDENDYPFKQYVGEGFELFAEILIEVMGAAPQLAMSSYTPIQGDDDQGVDGECLNANGDRCAIQVKYRGKRGRALLTSTKDNLKAFMGEAAVRGIPVTEDMRLYLITTAKGMNAYTSEVNLHGKVRCIGMPELRSLVDNNHAFWSRAREIINNNSNNNSNSNTTHGKVQTTPR